MIPTWFRLSATERRRVLPTADMLRQSGLRMSDAALRMETILGMQARRELVTLEMEGVPVEASAEAAVAPNYRQPRVAVKRLEAEAKSARRHIFIDETGDQTDAAVPNNCDPPQIAEFLLTVFASSSRAEAAIGDLNERFAGECREMGRRRAVRLYWARTLRSMWPLLRRATGKALKWGAVIAAMRRLF